MHVITLNNIAVNYGGKEIFGQVSWSIGDRDRIGLVGPNGAGKSSLLRVITGEVTPEAGAVNQPRGVTVGYLPQDVTLDAGSTLIDVATQMPPALAEVEEELARVEVQLGDPTVYNDMAKLDRVLARQTALLEQYDELGGAGHESRVREVLASLNLGPELYDHPVEALSGGQRKLTALGALDRRGAGCADAGRTGQSSGP